MNHNFANNIPTKSEIRKFKKIKLKQILKDNNLNESGNCNVLREPFPVILLL